MLADLPLDQPLPFRDPAGRELLDLNALQVPRPICTFYMRVAGHGLRSRGVFDLRPLLVERGQCLLAPLRPGEELIPVAFEEADSSPLFGVAVHAIHKVGPAALRRSASAAQCRV
ncbi:MAG: hypothetical protein ACKOBY_09900 [Cyanobium sp.]